MRKFIPFNKDYVGPDIEANSQHPEDLITSLAISQPRKGIRPLVSIKTAPHSNGTLYRPQINIGRAAHGDLDDRFEKEPEQGTDAHPYMNAEAMKHWGCHSRNWYGYNSRLWTPIKGDFYKKYYPEIHKDWQSTMGLDGPKIEDFVAEHGETQKAWNEWSKASLEHQTNSGRVSRNRLENGILVDPQQHFRNALFNVTSLYKDALASDGRNFPGRDTHSMLKKYFEKNPHLRSPNVEWATGHLEHLKNSIDEYASGKWNESNDKMSRYLKDQGFRDDFVEGSGLTHSNHELTRANPDIGGSTRSHLWMPNRQEPYGLHVTYHHNPLTPDPSRRHMFAVEKFLGAKKTHTFHPMEDLQTVIPQAMEEVNSKIGKSQQVHTKLLEHLGFTQFRNASTDWGFSGRRAPIDFGDSPEDFASKFLGK